MKSWFSNSDLSVSQSSSPSTHASSSLCPTLCLKALPSISFAPLQLGARRSFVLPILLPLEAANGMIVFPVKSVYDQGQINPAFTDPPPCASPKLRCQSHWENAGAPCPDFPKKQPPAEHPMPWQPRRDTTPHPQAP